MKLLIAFLVKIARSEFGGRIAGWMITHMSFLLPVHRLRETPRVLAFHHPQPSYRVHILLVPRQVLTGLSQLGEQDGGLLVEVMKLVQDLVRELDLENPGYRLIVNGGAYQDVKQLHFHLVSGPALNTNSK